MQNKYKLEFCFKGNRNYVHGTDIFNKLLEILKSEGIRNSEIDLSIHGISTKNITLLKTKPENLHDIRFVFSYFDQKNKKHHLFAIENEQEIDCRYEYPEEEICNQSISNLKLNEIELLNENDYSFIENIIALNKHLINVMFPNVIGKWYFTKLQLKKILFNKIYPIKLVFVRKFNFSLVKTEIFINNDSIGYVYISLVDNK